jgi:FAD/FMN-containing dehydrogenase
LGGIIEDCLRHGWFPPVLPGTCHVTIGGAIANDVHGKNHHRSGTFGHHVKRLWLQRSDRDGLVECSLQENADLFRSTIGGLGLTGVILSAEIQLKRVDSPSMDVEFVPFETLEQFGELSASSDVEWEYTVAWVDLVRATPDRLPGIFMRGNHARHEEAKGVKAPKALFRWPFEMPFCPFNRVTCGAFNHLYLVRQKVRAGGFRQGYGAFFHPLDVIDGWNKLYGQRGFFQYQCVIPAASGLDPFRDIFALLKKTRATIPLAVLKQTGGLPPAGLMSFPLPGWTLAMDLPNRGGETLELFSQLDGIVQAAGGRLYPAKDAAMTPGFFQESYPDWRVLEALRDPMIHSDFWKRVTEPID